MPTEMLGPGTEAALELLVMLETVLEDGGWDPLGEGEGSEDGSTWGVFASWWFRFFAKPKSGKILLL